MATVRDIAKTAGVSPSTVSRVLNGTAPVNQATREAVLAAIKELNYAPKQEKSKSAKKPTHIAIIMPQSSASNLSDHPTIYSIMSSFVSHLDTLDISNSIIMLDEHHIKDVEDLFISPADGYLVMCTNVEQEDLLIPYFKSKHIPYIIVNRWVQQKHCNYVNIDDVSASYDATKKLLEYGHKKIAFIGGNPNYRSTILRMKGYIQALESAGIPIREEYIITGEYTSAFGLKAANLLAKLPDAPTAGFFASDILAIATLRSMSDQGYRLPEDFSAIGYGDISIASFVHPPLTTIRVPVEDMGIQAAIALINLISNPGVCNIQVLLEANLIIRESCAYLK